MFINIFSSIMITFIIISIYLFIYNNYNNKSEIEIENFKPNNNQKVPINNFTNQFLNNKSKDNIKLDKLVKNKKKITPCCGGYYVSTNFGFNFN